MVYVCYFLCAMYCKYVAATKQLPNVGSIKYFKSNLDLPQLKVRKKT